MCALHPHCRWCAPYAYKQRPGLGCGGADKWTAEPSANAFPTTPWDAGSGSIFCDAGFFCPNTTAKARAAVRWPRPARGAGCCTTSLSYARFESSSRYRSRASPLQIECPKGYYCRRGSSSPVRCPPLMRCPRGADAPSGNTVGGSASEAAIFAVLWAMWAAVHWVSSVQQKAARRRAMRQLAAPSLAAATFVAAASFKDEVCAA